MREIKDILTAFKERIIIGYLENYWQKISLHLFHILVYFTSLIHLFLKNYRLLHLGDYYVITKKLRHLGYSYYFL